MLSANLCFVSCLQRRHSQKETCVVWSRQSILTIARCAVGLKKGSDHQLFDANSSYGTDIQFSALSNTTTTTVQQPSFYHSGLAWNLVLNIVIIVAEELHFHHVGYKTTAYAYGISTTAWSTVYHGKILRNNYYHFQLSCIIHCEDFVVWVESVFWERGVVKV